MQGDDAVHRGVQDRLDQRRAVAQGQARRVVAGDVAEHQHGADHVAVALADRRATVGDGALAAVARDEDGVVGQSLDGAVRQRRHHRDRRGLAGFLVDDAENLLHRAAGGFGLRPAGELLGKGIQQRHARLGVGGHHRVADGVERDRQLFLADLEGGIGQPQLPVRFLLGFEELLRFGMHQVLEPVPGFPVDQVGERKREHQRQQAGGDDDGEQVAHVRLEIRVVLRQRGFLDPGVAVDLGADRFHQLLAAAAADGRQHGRRFAAALRFDDAGHFRHFCVHQRNQRVQVPPGGVDPGERAQFLQAARDAVAHRQIGLQEGLVAGQRKAALAGFGVRQVGPQRVGARDQVVGVAARLRRDLDLPEGPERDRHHQRGQHRRSRERGKGLGIRFQVESIPRAEGVTSAACRPGRKSRHSRRALLRSPWRCWPASARSRSAGRRP